MPGLALFLFRITLVICLTAPLAARAGVAMPDSTIADMVARVQPGVVKIIVVHPPPKAPETATNQQSASAGKSVTRVGSGFVINSDGLVATNRHVIEDSISIYVVTADGTRYRAEIVGAALKADIALLRIGSDAHLPALSFGDSDSLRPGDTVVAIGSPFGFDNTVTAGIVSSVNRDIMESPFDDYIQTDAAINHGNSGGPLFNAAGQVVGMNSVLFGPSEGSAGVGFAIPSNDLKFVLFHLAKDGEVKGGMLPVRTQQVTGVIAEAIGAPAAKGALIAKLGPQAGMMDGKIQPGDVITRLNGEPVADPRDLARKTVLMAASQTATLELYRAGQLMTVTVPILPLEGKMPSSEANQYHPKTLGLHFAPAGGDQAGHGVVLTDIEMSGSAANAGLAKGDVILRVQQTDVATPEEAQKALQARIDAKQHYAAVLVLRDNEQTWVPVGLPD